MAGPDGALWFTDVGDSIGRITTSGVVTTFTDPSIAGPIALTVATDGALWFINEIDSSIGRITMSGAVTNFSDPGIRDPREIVAGPDGALWFTNAFPGSIGRLTTTGSFSYYTSPNLGEPHGITVGPDGALWFTDYGHGSIGRITTNGKITLFPDPSISGPWGIAAGGDGAMWFANEVGNSIGRITMTGTVTNYPDSTINGPEAITAGPDGAMWFGNEFGWSIGRIALAPPSITPGSASVVEGNSGTTTLKVPVTLSHSSPHSVTAHWNTEFVSGASGSQADPGSDYTSASGTVTLMPGQTATTVSISVKGDTLVEPDEYIVVSFTNPTNATIGGFYGLGFGTITNDDHAMIIPGSASVLEGNSGTTNLKVPVTLSNPSTQTITAHWATDFVPGAPPSQADPSSDYTATSGTVAFAPGQTSQTITISVNGDTTVESNEYIAIPFSDSTNATLGGFYGIGFGGITNDD